MPSLPKLLLGCLIALWLVGCSDDDNGNGTEAIQLGLGAECAMDADCTTEGSTCLLNFKGGYCGKSGCTGDADCPAGSACVTHDDGVNYCFLVCAQKTECNVSRTADNESNCSANVDFVDTTNQHKACVPPSGT
jgi:hypothetical protein